MRVLANHIVKRLIQIELGVHYGELPPPEHEPFVVIERNSPIVLSAPHGAITFRNDGKEVWHEEDEYTAGMALLLSEVCGTSVIATVWRTADSDPNHSPKERSGYKQAFDKLLSTRKIRWVIDLHGAKEKNDRLADSQSIDLGAGDKNEYLPFGVYQILVQFIENYLGCGATDRKDRKGIRASTSETIAAFAHSFAGVSSLQLEIKPSVRVPLRRVDASMYKKEIKDGGGPYSAPSHQVLGMLQAITDFIEHLQGLK